MNKLNNNSGFCVLIGRILCVHVKCMYLCLLMLVSFAASAQDRTTIVVSGTVSGTTSLIDKEVIINGKTDLHVTASATPLTNSVIRLNSENSWVFFDNIRPQAIIDSVLSNIYVFGIPAIYQTNVRVAIYRHGTVVVPLSTQNLPLTMYSGQSMTGDSMKFQVNTVYDALTTFDNRCRSFRLKRGYMATFYNNADRSGYSRVFIASDGDLEVPVMSSFLDRTVSAVRVVPWQWVSKKGWCQTGTSSGGNPETNSNKMNATWFYTWSADNSSKANLEYVPIRSQQYWPSWSQINALTDVSHVMAFNEPDHTEQSNVSVAQAIAQWPEFQKTGLRLGSPACTDFSAWLYPFMDSIKAHNYRLDYVVIHAYWGGYTASQWYTALKTIHDKTGRPIWIKEWNNGANWTTETWPSSYSDGLAKQFTELKAILNVLDTAHFIERYSIYNWVGSMRMMIADDGWVTPAGAYYRDSKPPLAFSRVNEVVPGYKFFSKPTVLSLVASSNDAKMNLSWTNGEQEFASEVIIDKKCDDGEYSELYRTNCTGTIQSYSDQHDFSLSGKFTYRVRIVLNNNTEVVSNEQSVYVTPGADVQYGRFSTTSSEWNTVAFKNNYTTIPAVFLGAPTNVNSSMLLTSKVKVISNRLMNFQLSPWTYQSGMNLSSEEQVPYFVVKPGSYNWGGIKAVVSKTTVSSVWKTVTFSTPFDTLPVVLATTASSNNAIPTTVRVRNVTKTGFEMKLQKESKNTGAPVAEICSYMAISQGNGMINGNKIFVGRTADNAVGNAVTQFAKITYPETISSPVFIAQMQSCNDDSVTATLRCRSVLSTEARVFKQREVSMGYTASATETAGYVLINPDIINDIVNPVEQHYRISPNPVSRVLHLSNLSSGDEHVFIYDMKGNLVLSKKLVRSEVDVSVLMPGSYILRFASGVEFAKFIKQ